MKRHVRSYQVLVIMPLFLASLFSSFATEASPGEWIPQSKKISGIIIEGETALILIEGDVPQDYIPSQCNSTLNTVDLNTIRGHAILSIALSARAMDASVRLVLGSCFGSRPLVTYIQL